MIAITAGFAAPAIATLFVTEGLAGAAAIASGLAALGGGSLAAGGLGMGAGIAVIVGGGTVLGGSIGAGTASILAISPDFAISQAAKLEVVMREILLVSKKDIRIAQEFIREQRQAINALEDEQV